MDPDLAFVVGIILGVFSIPAIVSAISEGRSPRVAAFVIMASGAMIVWAINKNPGGYSIEKIPETLITVVARYLT